jgi:hypothetical protein
MMDATAQLDRTRRSRILREGDHVSFEMSLMDAAARADGRPATDRSSPEKPTSLDEALKEQFAQLAEQRGTDVETLLAAMEQKQLEEIVSAAALSFVRSVSGGAVGRFFSDAQLASIRASALTIATIHKRMAKPKEASMKASIKSTAAIRDGVLRKRYAVAGGSAPATRDRQVGDVAPPVEAFSSTASIRDRVRRNRYPQV